MNTLNRNSATGNQPGRVLMVCCAFPPTGGPGVQRSVKFAKYLPQSGWLPTVWASDAMKGMPSDPTLLADLPDEVRVHRRPGAERFHAARRLTRWMMGAGGPASRVGAALDWRLNAWVEQSPRLDPFISWAQSSVEPVVKLVEREGVEVLYSTFSPASNHVLAMATKRRTGLPWVADFRDLWTDDYRYVATSTNQRRADRELEQQILETADVVIGVTERQTDVLAGHVPGQRHKFHTITNGFDPDDMNVESTLSAGRQDRFILAHVGRFDRWRTDDALFEGLAQFASALGEDCDRFVLRIVGHADESTLARVARAGVRCSFSGYVCHAEAVAEMQGADALLLCVPGGPNGDTVIPAKLFEYLASGRAILTVGPRGGASEGILGKCDAGICVPADASAIEAALKRLYDAWCAERPLSGCDPNCLRPFSRVELTQKLARLFDDVTATSRLKETQRAEPMEVTAP